MFVAYLWLCEEIGQRFLLLENCWLRSAHAHKMEKVRLLHEKISATAHLLDNAFGPRLILLMVDTYFQCTGFFIHTALFPSGRRFHSVLSYFALHIYCFLSSMTATDNVGIKVSIYWACSRYYTAAEGTFSFLYKRVSFQPLKTCGQIRRRSYLLWYVNQQLEDELILLITVFTLSGKCEGVTVLALTGRWNV